LLISSPSKALALRRRTLVESDLYLQKVLEAVNLLQSAVFQVSLECKRLPPVKSRSFQHGSSDRALMIKFNSDIEPFQSFDDQDSATLLAKMKLLFRRREKMLRTRALRQTIEDSSVPMEEAVIVGIFPRTGPSYGPRSSARDISRMLAPSKGSNFILDIPNSCDW
jgi:hypothetical protein